MSKGLEKYIGIIKFFGNALPSTFEVILFDLKSKGNPVVEQSNWASQTVKDTRKFLINALKNMDLVEKGCLLNQLMCTEKNAFSKISIYLIKENTEVIGGLCINMDCSLLLKMNGLLSELLPTEFVDIGESSIVSNGYILSRSNVGLDDITNIIKQFGVDPSSMTPQERLEVILDLDDVGVFKVKGAVARAAEELKMSEQSVYRYLAKIKKLKQ